MENRREGAGCGRGQRTTAEREGLGIVDKVIAETTGGAHVSGGRRRVDPPELVAQLQSLHKLDTGKVERRYERLMSYGVA